MIHPTRARVLTLLAVALAAIPSQAAAQSPFRIDLQHLHPSALPDAGLSLEGGPGLPAWALSIAATFNLGNTVQRIDDAMSAGGVSTVASTQAPLEASLALGLPLGFAVQLSLPVVLFTQDTPASRAYFQGIGYAAPLRGQGLGDPRLQLSWRISPTPSFTFLAAATATAPVLGSSSNGPSAELGSEHAASLLGVLGAEGRLFSLLVLRANVGVRGRFGEASLGPAFTVGSELMYGGGVELRPIAALHVLAEVYGSTALDQFGSQSYSPLELIAGLRIHPHRDFEATPFGGLGLSEGYGTPAWRVGVNLRLYPHLHDTDGDGVDDAEDRCASEREDRDDFEDADGCPDLDNDGDHVLDAADRCPVEPGLGRLQGCPDPDADHDGVGAGDRCPEQVEDADNFEDADGCPEPDNDGDNVLDAADRCPSDAEDLDGFEDTDGCPEADNDRDGIADGADRCPREAEDRDGFEDTDGCAEADNDADGVPDIEDGPPDPGGAFGVCRNLAETAGGRDADDPDGCPDSSVRVDVAARRIRVPPVFFATNADSIEQRSFADLQYVAEIMVANAWIQRIVVQGHTDAVGSEEHNLELSRRRAASVVRFLVEHGVAESRLAPEGFGRSRPPTVEDEPACRRVRSRACRQAARRVVFVIADIAAVEAPASPAPPAGP